MILFKLTNSASFTSYDAPRLHKIFPAGTIVVGGVGISYYVLDEPDYQRGNINTISARRLSPLESLAATVGDS